MVGRGTTTDTIGRSISISHLAEGPIYDPDGNGVLAEGEYHNVAGLEVTMYDSFLRGALGFIVLDILTVFLHLFVGYTPQFVNHTIGIITGLGEFIVSEMEGADDLLDDHEDMLLGQFLHHLWFFKELTETAKLTELVDYVLGGSISECFFAVDDVLGVNVDFRLRHIFNRFEDDMLSIRPYFAGTLFPDFPL